MYLALSEVFVDMGNQDWPLLLSEEDFEDMDVLNEDWEEIRDDSSRTELFDESRFEGISVMTKEDSKNESEENDVRNVSDIINEITGCPTGKNNNLAT